MPDMTCKRENLTPLELDEELKKILSDVAAEEENTAREADRERAEYRRWMAEKARHFEGTLRLYCEVYPLITAANKKWRQRVFRGEEPFTKDAERSLRALFSFWHFLFQPLEQKAEYFFRHGHDFRSQLPKLWELAQEARRILLTWQSPSLSLSPALRTMKPSPEEVAQARELFRR